jgi:hypothetical protein
MLHALSHPNIYWIGSIVSEFDAVKLVAGTAIGALAWVRSGGA